MLRFDGAAVMRVPSETHLRTELEQNRLKLLQLRIACDVAMCLDSYCMLSSSLACAL